jgi:hypothetical protein
MVSMCKKCSGLGLDDKEGGLLCGRCFTLFSNGHALPVTLWLQATKTVVCSKTPSKYRVDVLPLHPMLDALVQKKQDNPSAVVVSSSTGDQIHEKVEGIVETNSLL